MSIFKKNQVVKKVIMHKLVVKYIGIFVLVSACCSRYQSYSPDVSLS